MKVARALAFTPAAIMNEAYVCRAGCSRRRSVSPDASQARAGRGVLLGHAGTCAVRSATFQSMSNALHLTIRYEDAGDGWLTAQIAEIPGAISEGKTREEARSNVIDALDVLLTPDEELAGRPVEGSEALTLEVAS